MWKILKCVLLYTFIHFILLYCMYGICKSLREFYMLSEHLIIISHCGIYSKYIIYYRQCLVFCNNGVVYQFKNWFTSEWRNQRSRILDTTENNRRKLTKITNWSQILQHCSWFNLMLLLLGFDAVQFIPGWQATVHKLH